MGIDIDIDTVTGADTDTRNTTVTGVFTNDTVNGHILRCGLIAKTRTRVFPYVWDI